MVIHASGVYACTVCYTGRAIDIMRIISAFYGNILLFYFSYSAIGDTAYGHLFTALFIDPAMVFGDMQLNPRYLH